VADITRDDIATLIQEEYSSELLGTASTTSAVLSVARTVPLGTKVTNMPVLATLPEADFVSESATDDAGKKPTSKATWANKQFVVEEIAVIIPVHEDTLEDATEDLVTELTNEGGAAIGRKLDGAILFATDKPATWTSPGLLAAAVGAGQAVTVSPTPGEDDLAGSIYQAAGLVDEAGWDPGALLAPRGLRYRLANLRGEDGAPIVQGTLQNGVAAGGSVIGLEAGWVPGMVWDRDEAEALVIDPMRVLVGIRQDITVKFLDQATVGGINLAERDMVALRFKARYAYVLGNTRTQEGDAPKVPVAAVLPASGS
jgi:HK97 family phage major capsid protein